MNYTTLGKTELEVSPITIGAWQLGGPLFFDGKPDGHPDPGKETVLRMIRELGDLGINAIDTAEQYSAGESERRVGEALRGVRDQWIISTKFGYRVGDGGTRIDDSTPPTIMPSLEGSLKRLQTDRIDIYLYHCAPEIHTLEAGRAVLEQAKTQGKIRHYGISTNDLPLIKAMVDAHMLDVLQYADSLLDNQTQIREFVHKHNIGTQVRGVMAQGRLSGKYFHTAPAWRSDDNRSNGFHDHDFRQYSAFEEFIPAGYTMAETAIRWILDQPGNSTLCMGAKNIDDYRTAINATTMPALPEEIANNLAACAARLRPV